MASWGVPQLQKEPDPRGYIVFSEGRCDQDLARCSSCTTRVYIVSRHQIDFGVEIGFFFFLRQGEQELAPLDDFACWASNGSPFLFLLLCASNAERES